MLTIVNGGGSGNGIGGWLRLGHGGWFVGVAYELYGGGDGRV